MINYFTRHIHTAFGVLSSLKTSKTVFEQKTIYQTVLTHMVPKPFWFSKTPLFFTLKQVFTLPVEMRAFSLLKLHRQFRKTPSSCRFNTLWIYWETSHVPIAFEPFVDPSYSLFHIPSGFLKVKRQSRAIFTFSPITNKLYKNIVSCSLVAFFNVS